MWLFKQAWHDFKDIWRNEIYWGLIGSAATAIYQWYKGVFANPIRDNLMTILIPYACIAGLFIFGNLTRTLYVRERDALRKKRRAERRREHRAEIDLASLQGARPNLECSKLEAVPIDLDSTGYHLLIPGHSGSIGLILSVSNDVPHDRKVAFITDVMAKLYFFSGPDELLEDVEMACWTEGPIVRFGVGSTNHIILLFTEKHEKVPRALERVHGQIIKKRLPENLSDIIVSLTAPRPIYNQRFHIKFAQEEGICRGDSCAFCEKFVLKGTGLQESS